MAEHRGATPAVRRPRVAARGPLALALVVAGLAATVAAGFGLAAGPSPVPPAPPGSGRSWVPTAGASLFAIGGPSDVVVSRVTYQPGQASSWHMHNGLHAVEVLAGTLTIYDQGCRPHPLMAGESYVGGTDGHMARNETDEPVDMVVTYIVSAGTSMADWVIPMPAPTGCGSADAASARDGTPLRPWAVTGGPGFVVAPVHVSLPPHAWVVPGWDSPKRVSSADGTDLQ